MRRENQSRQRFFNLSDTARQLENHFKTPISKQLLTRWRKLDPPFPSPATTNGRYNLQECKKWVEKNRAHLFGDGEQSSLFNESVAAKARKQIAEANQAEFDLAKNKREFIKRGDADMAVIRALKLYHALAKRELERDCISFRRDKLKAMGIDPAKISAFVEYDTHLAIESVTRIEDACKELGGKKETE